MDAIKATRARDAAGVKPNHRKINKFTRGYKVVYVGYGNEIESLIDCRIYDTPSKTYACIWVNDLKARRNYCSGSGCVSGYGYHTASAAVGEAIAAAGYDLTQPIDGRGNQAIEAALLAIAEQALPASARELLINTLRIIEIYG